MVSHPCLGKRLIRIVSVPAKKAIIMPTVLRIGSFRFHFYSDERNEPPHIHVKTPDGECKFWLNPIRLARNKNESPKVIRDIDCKVG